MLNNFKDNWIYNENTRDFGILKYISLLNSSTAPIKLICFVVDFNLLVSKDEGCC
jgi:hypothetical protein